MKRLLLLILLLSLNACSNLSPAIRNAPSMDLKPEQVLQNPGHYRGEPVRWGGIIIGVENENEVSRLQILSYPLNYYGRPHTSREYGSRFIVESKKFLDPAIFKLETEITIAGTVLGEVKRMIDKKTLTLPLISLKEVHLWPPRYYYNDFYYDDYFYRPYYPYGYGHHYHLRPFLRFYHNH